MSLVVIAQLCGGKCIPKTPSPYTQWFGFLPIDSVEFLAALAKSMMRRPQVLKVKDSLILIEQFYYIHVKAEKF